MIMPCVHVRALKMRSGGSVGGGSSGRGGGSRSGGASSSRGGGGWEPDIEIDMLQVPQSTRSAAFRGADDIQNTARYILNRVTN